MKSFEQVKYDQLINFRKNIEVLDKMKYPGVGEIELHHIQPKSLNGSNDDYNLVYLFPREHYIAHLLLQAIARQIYGETSKEYEKMLYAFKMMGINGNRQNRKFHMNSRLYEKLKQKSYGFLADDEYRKKISASKLGEKNPNFGKFGKDNPNFGSHRTDEQKKHISDAIKAYFQKHPNKKGRQHYSYGRISVYNIKTLKIKRLKKQDVDSYIQTGEWIIGVPEMSDETKKKISKAKKGKNITAEQKKNITRAVRKNMKGEKGKRIRSKISESVKKLIWIYNINTNGNAIRVPNNEFGEFCKYKPNDGWVHGRRVSFLKNSIWLHKNKKRVRLNSKDTTVIQEYLSKGYKYGLGSHITGLKRKQ